MVEQKLLISSSVPGSWAPKSLRETQHRQPLCCVGLVQGLQSGVLLGEATAAGHVHDQQHLAGVVAQGFAAAVRVVTETELTLIAMVKQGWSAGVSRL